MKSNLSVIPASDLFPLCEVAHQRQVKLGIARAYGRILQWAAEAENADKQELLGQAAGGQSAPPQAPPHDVTAIEGIR